MDEHGGRPEQPPPAGPGPAVNEQMPPPPAAPGHTPPGAGAATSDDRTWGMFAHLAALVALAGMPVIGSIGGPLIVWLVKRDSSPFVDDQGKEAVNFQITVAIAAVVAFLALFVIVGFLLLPAVAIYWLVFTVIGGIKANEGVAYRYPMTIRFIK